MFNKKLLIYRNLILNYLFKILPVKEKQFYFCAFHGQYCDSPRRISEKIHEAFPSTSIYWEINDKSHEILPDYIHSVEPDSITALLQRSCSRVIIENYMGWIYGYTSNKGIKFQILKGLKKKGQLNISTWHGTALKKISIDEPRKADKKWEFFTSSDYLLCNSEFLRNILSRITYGQLKIVMSGSPRNDILFSYTDQIKKDLKEKLGIPKDKKVLLYAPTFRNNNVDMSGAFQMRQLKIDKLLTLLKKKFGGEWVIVFRAHDSVIRELKTENFEINPNVISGNKGDDMAEYQVITDVLLTDYSGTFFDFLSTKRPCFLYCPDFDHYFREERGFYLDAKTLPYTIAKNVDELYAAIENFNNKEYEVKVRCFIDELGIIDDGKASERVVQLIMKEIR